MYRLVNNRRILIVTLVMLLILPSCSASSTKQVAAGCSPTDTSRTGANFGSGSMENTGAQPGPAIVDTPKLLWSIPVSEHFYDMSVDEDAVYVTDSKSKGTRDLTVYDRLTGSELWKLPLGTDYLTPSVLGEQLLVADQSGTLFALGLPSAQGSAKLDPLWETSIAARLGPVWQSGNSLFMMTGNIVGGPNEVTVLDSTTGKVLWNTAFPKVNGEPQYSLTGAFSVGEGGVYAETDYGQILGISAVTGNICWKQWTDPGISLHGPAIADGNVFIVTDNSVRAYDYLTGEQQWKREDGAFSSGLAVSDEGFVFYGTDDGSLQAVGARSGEIKWALETGDFAHAVPSLVDGVVYANSGDGTLFALDATTGWILWTLDVGTLSAGQRPILIGGILYLVADNELRAYDNF